MKQKMSIIHVLTAYFRVEFMRVEICKTAHFNFTRLSMPFPSFPNHFLLSLSQKKLSK